MSTVQTLQGPVTGEWIEEVLQFRGLPYAEAPCSPETRFQPPRPPGHRDSVLHAARSQEKVPQARSHLSTPVQTFRSLRPAPARIAILHRLLN